MRNIALRLRYDGGAYHGWQVQKNAVTVAGTLNAAVGKICGHTVNLTGCGRTDAGVHAKSYCANFRTESTIPSERLPLAVNALLPADIAVTGALDVPEGFNAIQSCIKKEYTYLICNTRIRDPFYAGRAYYYPRVLNIADMRAAAEQLTGRHDFAALRSVGTVTKTTVRCVHWLKIDIEGELLLIRVCADGFLYNMARAIAGTLLYVSEGKITPGDVPMILETRDRRLSGPTVPPHGLYLTQLWYEGEAGNFMNSTKTGPCFL